MGKPAGSLTWDEAMQVEKCSTLIIGQGYIDAAEEYRQSKVVIPISGDKLKNKEEK
jgi:hypothetical protein